DQHGASNPVIQLPTFGWMLQPRIPGRFTQNLSIHKTGTDMIHRVLRVEGLDAAGHAGYWERDIADAASADWVFSRTDEPLRGALLGSAVRNAGITQGASEDRRYVHPRGKGDDNWLGELLDFNVYCSPARLRVTVAQDPPFELILHTTDVIRQSERARGLDGNSRAFSAAVEIPRALHESLSRQPADTQAFLQRYLGSRRFTATTASGVVDRISVDGLGWVFAGP
ncbi:MAG: hypothetical protein ABUL69_05015, partial [Peristeroidobacter soli]